MTTAYTSLLGFALPVTGELSGTWGDTVNNGITSLLDSAIAGTTTLSADSDVTLTTTQGSSNTAREAILLWTAGGSATRTITAPAQSKIYTVINASSGTQSIILAGAGPTSGVTIAKGESALCAWNGSDFIKISNTAGPGTFTNLTVTGNTSLGDADTDTITQAASYVTGTQLKSAKTATNTLSLAAYDVDGTAYTNLITLTASNTPTLALTSTGVGTMNNITIGNTAAAAGTFTSVTNSGLTSGRVTFASTAGLLADSANLAFDGTNLGLGGTTNSYGSQTAMTLSGTIVSRIDFRSNSTFTGTILSYQAVTEGLRLQTEAGYPIAFYPAGTEAMRIGVATGGVGAVGIGYTSLTSVGNNGLAVLGNVGIGTSSPSGKLTVNGAIYVLDNFALTLGSNQGGGATLLYNTNGNLDITPRNTFSTVFTAGNVGIGTNTPAYKLDVSGNIRGLINNASVGNASAMGLTQNGSGDAAISFLIGSTTEWLVGVDNSDSDSFKINNATGGGDFNTTGITLTTGGSLGIGTTSPSQKLSVVGGTIRCDVGAVGTSLIVTGTGSNLQVGHTSSSYVTLENSGGGILLKPSDSVGNGVIQYNANTGNKSIRWVITQGDGGSNTIQTYWNNTYTSAQAGGCLGAYDRSGNYVAPGTSVGGSNEYAIYGFVSYSL